MSADTSNPITGKDAKITLLSDGVLVEIQDAVTNFESEPQYETVETKPLGSTAVLHDATHIGWRLQVEVSMVGKEIDEFLDAVHAASKLRVPLTIAAQESISYRDGTSKRYTYVNLKLTGAPKQLRRGDAGSHRLTFMTGDDRIAG